MERRLDPFDLVIGLRGEVTAVQASVGHLSADVGDVKQDLRRLDDRVFHVVLLQLGTLTTSLGALVAAIVGAFLR